MVLGIGIASGQYYWVLYIGWLSWYRSNPSSSSDVSALKVVLFLACCHNISVQRAEVLGREDEFRLLKNRQLALLVDLDQTLLHTTNDNIPPNLKVSFAYCLMFILSAHPNILVHVYSFIILNGRLEAHVHKTNIRIGTVVNHGNRGNRDFRQMP